MKKSIRFLEYDNEQRAVFDMERFVKLCGAGSDRLSRLCFFI